MGYTHRWFREREIDSVLFQQIESEFKKLLPKFSEIGILLADVKRENHLLIHNQLVSFNGKVNCGHPKIQSFINPWPSSNAGGIALSIHVKKQITFAGTCLESRCCDGNCSSEPFNFPRILLPQGWHSITYRNKYRQLCKTSFRPYDIAVTAFLIIAKHHLDHKILVTSDGNDHQWFDAKLLCQMELGYGLDFQLDT